MDWKTVQILGYLALCYSIVNTQGVCQIKIKKS